MAKNTCENCGHSTDRHGAKGCRVVHNCLLCDCQTIFGMTPQREAIYDHGLKMLDPVKIRSLAKAFEDAHLLQEATNLRARAKEIDGLDE